MTRREWLPLAALALILAITALWWALALWPLPGEAPAWLAEARFVCFGATRTGLPDSAGWLLLIGEPAGLLGLLVAVWGRPLRDGMGSLTRLASGRAALAMVAILATAGLSAAGHRVAQARSRGPDPDLPGPERGATIPPALPLVTQHGEAFGLDRLRGRTALIVFAYGHCETVCPVAVRDALAARDGMDSSGRARVVVVTLDPWRDVPARLPALAAAWRLSADDFALSGEVETVERVLDAWQVSRSRNPATGEVVHAPLTVVLDSAGLIIGRSQGTAAQLAGLLVRD